MLLARPLCTMHFPVVMVCPTFLRNRRSESAPRYVYLHRCVPRLNMPALIPQSGNTAATGCHKSPLACTYIPCRNIVGKEHPKKVYYAFAEKGKVLRTFPPKSTIYYTPLLTRVGSSSLRGWTRRQWVREPPVTRAERACCHSKCSGIPLHGRLILFGNILAKYTHL